jgi:UPF0288 family protein (methanogenesis marker protein 3)
MITIHLDGRTLELQEGSRLSSILSGHPAGCAVAVIRPATQEQTTTASLAIGTTAGEITIELSGEEPGLFDAPGFAPRLALHWSDRYAAAFGPFPSAIRPARKPHVYDRGDVILGCGGYEPERSLRDPGIRPIMVPARAGALWERS